MTAPILLAYICAALLLQVGAAIAVAFWHQRKGAAGAAAAGRPITSPLSSAGWSGWREFRVARRQFEDSAGTQCSFYLEPADGAPLPPFTAGQFLTVAIPVSADKVATRCYSLSDRPNPTHYRITVKRIPSPRDQPGVPPGVLSNHFHDRVREGDILKVKAPSGHFCLDADVNRTVVFIAGGVGIAPMMSMLAWCLDAQPERTLHLYYGVRNGHEHAFKASLEALARSHPRFHLNVIYSRPGADDRQGRDYNHLGHANIELLQQTLPHGRHQFYVCGPAAMMESMIPALSHWGVPAQDIHFEAFGPTSVRSVRTAELALSAIATTALEIRFRRSGRTLVWSGQDDNLLDFAERNGVRIDSGCRSGSCGACETQLVSGTVRYNRTPDHVLAAGRCLLCVAAPESALVLEA